MPWGPAIAAGGSLLSGIIGSNATSNAAKTEANAANNATNAELSMYNQTVAREQPYLSAGNNALTQLMSQLGLVGGPGNASSPILQMLGIGTGPGTTGNINPATFQGSPGYQYQLQQGTNAVTNANASTGIGGNALRALQQTGQGLANQNWNQYLGNASGAWQQLLGQLSGLVAGGQNAAANLGGIGTAVGGQVGGNAIGAGNALGNGMVNSASALAGGINGGINNLNTGLASSIPSNATLPYLLQQLFSGSGGGASGFDNGGVLPNTPNISPGSPYSIGN